MSTLYYHTINSKGVNAMTTATFCQGSLLGYQRSLLVT